jgi:hypothetical protein
MEPRVFLAATSVDRSQFDSDVRGILPRCLRAPMKLQNKTRRVAGIEMLLLAVLGLLLCLGGTAGAWFIKSRVDAVGDAVFGSADEAFGIVDEKLNLVTKGLEGSRESADKLSRIATRLRNEETDVRQEHELLLQFLDKTHQHWQAAASWLDSAEVLASGVGGVTEALVSSDFAVSRQDSTSVAAARDVQAYAVRGRCPREGSVPA